MKQKGRSKYTEVYFGSQVKNYSHSTGKSFLLLPAVKRQIPKTSKGKLLDVGCGPGDMYHVAREKGYQYYGIDLSTEMLQTAQQKYPGGIFKLADATKFAHLFKEKFGIVLSIMVLPCFRSKAKLYKSLVEMKKLLTPEGKIILGLGHSCFDPYMQKYIFKNKNVETNFKGYFSSGDEFSVKKNLNKGVMVFNDHHWPISDYISAINKAGLRLSFFDECRILTDKNIKWNSDFTKQRLLIPTYMVLTCKKQKSYSPSKYKMIFFDMEGVLVKAARSKEASDKIGASAWTAVYRSLGVMPERKKLRKKFENGTFSSYMDWTDAACDLLKSHNLTKNKFKKLIKDQKYIEGAKETIRELKKRGFKIGLITGSFTMLAQRVKKELGIDEVRAHCDLKFDGQGKLQDWKLMPCDYEGKVSAFKEIANKYGIKTSECVYVGDEVNDILLFQKAGFSIAFNCKKDLARRAANAVVDKRDLRSILPLL